MKVTAALDIHALPLAPNFSSQVLFRRARETRYFIVQHKQELNSIPYKYNILLQNINPNEQHYVGLYIVHDKEEPEYVPNAILVERIVSKKDKHVELRISFQVYSYMYNSKLFVVKVFDSMARMVAETNAFEIVARKNRKRTPSKK